MLYKYNISHSSYVYVYLQTHLSVLYVKQLGCCLSRIYIHVSAYTNIATHIHVAASLTLSYTYST